MLLSRLFLSSWRGCMSFSVNSKVLKNAFFENATTRFINESIDSSQSTLFKAFRKEYDGLTRLVSIPLAPIGLLITAVEKVLTALYHFLRCLCDLLTLNGSEAKKDFLATCTCLLEGILAVVAIPFSPLINLLDLLVGGALTLGNMINPQNDNSFNLKASIRI